MKRSSITFLQVVIVLLGIAAALLLIGEPQREGVNTNKTNYQIYLQDPFLALVYAGSIPFFVALYHAFSLLGYVKQDKTYSPPAVAALRTIKRCALVIIGFVLLEEVFIMLNHGDDDAAGAVAMGIMITFGSIVVASAAAMFERILQKGVDLKTENDLTV